MKLSNKIMVSSWMGDPMVCIYSSWIIFVQVEFFEVNFRWNFAVNPFRFFGKISTWKKIPGGKICIFHLILLLYIAFHLYSISCEGEKSTSIFLRFHLFKFAWIPAGLFRTGCESGSSFVDTKTIKAKKGIRFSGHFFLIK